VLVAFQVAESFESDQVAKTGIYNPQPGESIVGGHQVLAVGYDIGAVSTLRPAECAPALLIQNSWGPDWGLSGFFWMPLPIVDDATSDLWMTHPGKSW
jgi:C1A family cysteine protease